MTWAGFWLSGELSFLRARGAPGDWGDNMGFGGLLASLGEALFKVDCLQSAVLGVEICLPFLWWFRLPEEGFTKVTKISLPSGLDSVYCGVSGRFLLDSLCL